MQSLAAAGGPGTSDRESCAKLGSAVASNGGPLGGRLRRFSTVAFLRSRRISLKNDAKLRYTFASLPNESPYEKHALQNCATLVRAFRSQMLYPIELRAPETNT